MTSPTLRRSREAYARASPHKEPTQTYRWGRNRKACAPVLAPLGQSSSRHLRMQEVKYVRMPVQLHIKHTRTPSRHAHSHVSSRLIAPTDLREKSSDRPSHRQLLCSLLRVRAYPPARPTTPIPKPTQAGARTKRKHKLKVLGTDPHRTPQTEKQQYSTLRLDKPLTIHPRSLRYARAGPNGQRSSLLLSFPSFFLFLLFPPSFLLLLLLLLLVYPRASGLGPPSSTT